MLFDDFRKMCVAIVGDTCKAECDDIIARQLFDSEMWRNDSMGSEEIAEWLESELLAYFPSLGERPQWVRESFWPYFEGKPMCFVRQFAAPSNSLPQMPCEDDIYYLFCSKKTDAKGRYEFVYRLIGQCLDVPGTHLLTCLSSDSLS